MSGLALGAAFASVQLVYQAYSKVKSNKARCARLVERCQLVVDRLQRIVATSGDEPVIERIRELEQAFEYTAYTIAQVGQQGLIASLVQSEANAIRIESCNEVLTQLVALFHLEQVLDVQRWQHEFEAARLRDHEELLRLGRRIESGNAAIAREVAQQGTTISEVYRLVQNINTSLQDAGVANEPLTIQLPPPLPSESASSNSSSSRPSRLSFGGERTTTSSNTSPESVDSEYTSPSDCRPTPSRRLSWASRVGLTPLSAVFSKLPTPTRARYPESPRTAYPLPSPWEPDTPSSIIMPAKPGLKPLALTPTVLDSPLDLPPPYYLHVTNPAPDDGLDSDSEGGALATFSQCLSASSEAVRALDSPIPCLPSPFLSTECVFGSSENCSVKDKDVDIKVTVKRATSTVAPGILRRKRPIAFARRNTIASAKPPLMKVSEAAA